MQGGVPVAPESRNLEFAMRGDSYSNINAGKILLVLEGIGGLSYSVDDDMFSFADNLPSQWQWMEFRVPVIDKDGQEHWVKARADRQQSRDGSGIVEKRVSVKVGNSEFYFFCIFQFQGNPFSSLLLKPWLEDRQLQAAQLNCRRN